MRLNKFLAKSGIASRRKSDELIKMAMATVNDEIILDPAYQVKNQDEVRYDGKILKIDDNNASTLNTLGLCFLKLQKYNEANKTLL